MNTPKSRARSVRRFSSHSFRKLLASAAAVLLVGWLGSGSCFVSYCSEDCDPCLQQCRCSHTNCSQTSTSFKATHALTDFEVVDRSLDVARLHRTFIDVVGLSVQRAGGPAVPEASDIVRFAQGVLAVNSALLARSDCRPAFEFDSVHGYETGWVVQFHQDPLDPERAAANAQSFLFDVRGNLVEIDQTIGD